MNCSSGLFHFMCHLLSWLCLFGQIALSVSDIMSLFSRWLLWTPWLWLSAFWRLWIAVEVASVSSILDENPFRLFSGKSDSVSVPVEILKSFYISLTDRLFVNWTAWSSVVAHFHSRSFAVRSSFLLRKHLHL